MSNTTDASDLCQNSISPSGDPHTWEKQNEWHGKLLKKKLSKELFYRCIQIIISIW